MTLREILHALADKIADHVDATAIGSEYYDQDSSPLPASVHVRLVRRGTLVGYRVGKRVLVRRADMHTYISRHKVEPNVAAEDPNSEERAVVNALERLGVKGGSRAA